MGVRFCRGGYKKAFKLKIQLNGFGDSHGEISFNGIIGYDNRGYG